jgi:hypothetical protein
MVLLEQHIKLGSLGSTFGWPLLYASSGIPIWALYNKFCLQVHISTGPMDQLQLLVKEYSPLPMHEPSVQFYQGPLETMWVNT